MKFVTYKYVECDSEKITVEFVWPQFQFEFVCIEGLFNGGSM
jgi:hypothetical protein